MKPLTYLVLLFLLFSCKKNDETNQNVNSSKQKGNLVLYFKEIPENWKFSKEGGSYVHKGRHEVSYTQNLITKTWSPDYSKKIDTLVIKNIDDDLELVHKYRGLDELSYLFEPNDTVLFEYFGKIPAPKVLNREYKAYDFDYESLKREMIVKDAFPSELMYHSPMFFVEKLRDFNPKMEKELKKNHKKNAHEELKSEKVVLDSLLQKSLISRKVYDFYRLRSIYQEKAIDLEEQNYSMASIGVFKSELLDYLFYRKYLEHLVSSRFGIKSPITRNGISLNHKDQAVYDSIDNSRLFDFQERKYLSFIYLQRIINTNPNSVVVSYYEKFRKSYNDSSLIGFLKREYNLENEISTDLKLRNSKNSTTTLSKVIEENKSKVIYIDFWASWCAPCRKAMSASNELRKAYQGKNVVFLYLALNDMDENWRTASKEENLNEYDFNYFIDNSKSATFIDDLSIHRIPRYLIYNKKGELAHPNAPSPEKDEIRDLLDYFIDE